MTTVSIHAPSYLPWPIFFDKVTNCDIFVFLDDIQYKKNEYQNRNRLRTKEDPIHITIPVKSSITDKINEVRIDNSKNWKEKHKKTIEINYKKYPYFNSYWDDLEKIYEKNYDLLIDINLETINFLLKKLKINTKTIFSSELGIRKKGSDRLLEICKSLNAKTYFSGRYGTNFIKEKDFTDNKIQIKFQEYNLCKYQQKYKPFIPDLSTLDVLFNNGEQSKKIIKSN